MTPIDPLETARRVAAAQLAAKAGFLASVRQATTTLASATAEPTTSETWVANPADVRQARAHPSAAARAATAWGTAPAAL